MKVTCPKCRRSIDADDVNVATDVAVCRECNEVFVLSLLRDGGASEPLVDLDAPPSGTWCRATLEGFEVGASTRHPIALFLVPLMIFVSGGSLGMYGSQIASGEFDLFMSLFGIPLLLISVIFWTFALMAVCGKVRVTVDGNRGEVFTGLGSVGRRRRFAWSEVATVKERPLDSHYPGSSGWAICLEGKRRIRFGTGLRKDRRYFLLLVLRKKLAERR